MQKIVEVPLAILASILAQSFNDFSLVIIIDSTGHVRAVFPAVHNLGKPEEVSMQSEPVINYPPGVGYKSLFLTV